MAGSTSVLENGHDIIQGGRKKEAEVAPAP